MDYKSIRELIEAVSKSELSHLEVESEGLRIVMKKEVQQAVVTTVLDNVYGNRQREILEQPVTVTRNAEEVQKTVAAENIEASAAEKAVENLKVVASPIVGTFYSSASPDSPAFVKVGSKVKKGDVLCIVEAMKLMNEIESEFDGEIVEILAYNEQLVEYNQPLFKIKA